MKKIVAILLTACLMVLGLAACGGSNGGGAQPAATEAATEAAAAATEAAAAATEAAAAATDAAEAATQAAEAMTEAVQNSGAEGKSVGFVTFGLGGDFFQSLADAFVAKMTEAGWDAQYADGQFDPGKQIEAAENYIAMGVDVLVVWSVAPEAMDSVIQSAKDKGIKFLAFVAPTSSYDLLMVSDDAELADNCNKLAAQWIDEHFADAEDHSVPVAVFTCRTAETGVVQGDELLKIEEYSKKAKMVQEVECSTEDMNEGQQKAENLYTTNPEIQIFLTAHSAIGMGINSFYTSASSPVTDYKDMGIYLINGDLSTAEFIQKSGNNESPIRGMVLTGGVDDTAQEILDGCEGLVNGTIEPGTIKKADTIFVNAATAEEFASTGKTSITEADFE